MWGGWSTDQALRLYLAARVPPEKIILGVGFYGRAFQGVGGGSSNDGLYQRYKSLPNTPPYDEGTISYVELEKLLRPGSGFTRYWDDRAKSPYLYNGDMWITYTDEQQIKLLTAYVKEKGLGGVFTWEYAHDMNGTLLKVLAENSQ
jgi:chitinase